MTGLWVVRAPDGLTMWGTKARVPHASIDEFCRIMNCGWQEARARGYKVVLVGTHDVPTEQLYAVRIAALDPDGKRIADHEVNTVLSRKDICESGALALVLSVILRPAGGN